MENKNFSLSIVSHGHKDFIIPLLEDLAALGRCDFEVILTLNVPEQWEIDAGTFPFPVIVIRNLVPKRFAENHNAAFNVSRGDYFVVLNPDISLDADPFDDLLALLRKHPNSLCAPLIVNKRGILEDSARHFPTPLFLVKKFLAKIFNVRLPNDFFPAENGLSRPDWVAGMFVVVPRSVYEKLCGLDERYRMYYEDVDFCARARLAGCNVLLDGHVKVVHEAQRDSHRKVRYFVWHLSSALRFFTSSVFLKIQLNRWLANWLPQ